ncbi:Hsp20/alpha crystallin family protein [Palleronia sp. KMU-117]|uniref:Hsp20/alpha crystallin family protein n=1 Tax=Palleronia sp. KMU-117 TaxID=3434108 RepID=UPI003D72637F
MTDPRNVTVRTDTAKDQPAGQAGASGAPSPEPAPRPSAFGMLRHEIDRLFDDFSWPEFGAQTGRELGRGLPPAWRSLMRGGAPAMDLVERAGEYEVQVELPGLSADEIDIRMTDGTLVISGEKTAEHKEEHENTHISERSYGSFQRAFRLPGGIAADKVEARFENGVLKVRMPKTDEARESERTIKVTAA